MLGDPGKPRFRFRLDFNLYAYLYLTTMSDIEIFDWFTTSILGWQLSLLFVLEAILEYPRKVCFKFCRSFYLHFMQLLSLVIW